MVERLGARLRRFERDPQLLLDALLSDEVVESARAERALRLLFLRMERRRQELAHAAAAPRSASTNALLGRQVGIDVRQRTLGVDDRVAELDERVAGDEVPGCVRHGGERLLRRPRRASP